MGWHPVLSLNYGCQADDETAFCCDNQFAASQTEQNCFQITELVFVRRVANAALFGRGGLLSHSVAFSSGNPL